MSEVTTKTPAPKKSELKERVDSLRTQISALVVKNISQGIELNRLRLRLTEAYTRVAVLNNDKFENEARSEERRVGKECA